MCDLIILIPDHCLSIYFDPPRHAGRQNENDRVPSPGSVTIYLNWVASLTLPILVTRVAT